MHKRYVDYFTQFNVVPVGSSFEETEGIIKRSRATMRLSRISRIVYDQNEDNQEKLKNVYSAVSSYGSSCALILKACKTHTDVFIGTQSQAGERGNVPGKVFQGALIGNFPGLGLEDVKGQSNLAEVLVEKPKFLANVLGVPSLKDEEGDSFTQGIEKIVEALSGKELCAVLLASPVTRDQLDLAEVSYQEIYSALSYKEQQQFTLSTNESRTFGSSLSEGLTKTITEGITTTESTTSGETKNVGKNIIASTKAQFMGGHQSTAGNKSETSSKTKNFSDAVAESLNKTTQNSETKGGSQSQQFTFKDRGVADVLQLIDEQLERLRECKNLGMWNWGAYFFGQDEIAVKTGANIYAGLLSGESSGVERSSVSLWRKEDDEAKFKGMMDYLVQLRHPVLEMPEIFSFRTTLPASLISTKEMAVAMSLPQKSLPGIPVFDSVEFGRAVSTYSKCSNGRKIEVGSVAHLGSVNSRQKVSLDVDSLTSHLFITGSTGSGKSNTIYSILHDLWENKDVPFLIIEPAKGEYKDVFGGRDDVSVFGTNADKTPLLRVNPFSFPEDIHVTEHIDRLIEILNAVWPMYAAMPAILKAGIEKAYQRMGWDLLSSENAYDRVFPDFQDLLEVLPGIIEGSDYSAEMKGNYTGALITRIESMTNGYYRSIFQKDELESDILFDKPCIVDLSRVGSSETKSLLMGIVFMKLQEYRMSSAKGSNAQLKHITVLEEAHNLMRRTSFDQSGEGANLQGKAVEMISNAIAEMRTYGEGFIIADQAPGLLDQSVIRNTNTKVILRLPDWEDRELVGKAANLKDEQIEELARLRTGCAAVYQNDWQEAVLCQFDPFEKENESKFKHTCGNVILDSRLQYRREFLRYLLKLRKDKILPANSPETVEQFGFYFLPVLKRLYAYKAYDQTALDGEITALVDVFEITKVKEKKSIDDWIASVLKEAFSRSGKLDSELRKELVSSLFCHFISREKAKSNESAMDHWEREMEKVEHWERKI